MKPKKIIYSSMMADLLHYGHLQSLKYAKSLGDYHICGVLSDEASVDWWGNVLTNYNERKSVIQELECVDEVWEQKSKDSSENLIKLREKYPDAEIIVIKENPEWLFEDENTLLKQLNIKYVQSKYYPKLSRENIVHFFSNIHKKNKIKIEHHITNNNLKKIVGQSITKANVLNKLKNFLKKSKIEKLYYFTVKDWGGNKEKIIEDIQKTFNNKIVVRSSSLNEDSIESSNAGCFESVLNVNSKNINEINNAIGKVINSFNKENNSDEDQILIQTQTTEILCSGVLFTRNLSLNMPYYVINYDDTTQNTDTVTSGLENKKVEILRDLEINKIPLKWRKLIEAVKEIEENIKGIALDIEFAINKKNEIILFQVRPLAANIKYESYNDKKIIENIKDLKEKFNVLQNQNKFDLNIYLSDMAFWNPAEIIGDVSNYLDYSLYNHLILNESWIKGLVPLGYSETPKNLLEIYGSKTYINLLYSFLSLTPNDLSDNLKKKLLTFYNKKIKENPYLHDKIEFKIVFNCYNFNLDNQLKELEKNNFSNEEIKIIKKSLINLTSNTINNYEKILEDDLKDIKKLESLRNKYLNKEKNYSWKDKINGFVNLIEECRNNGTEQFSRMARLGFIANIFLKSLIEIKITDNDTVNEFMNSISTVATQFNQDFDKMLKNQVSKEEFLKKYGHLRPGTYDITKLPYNKNPNYLETNTNMEFESKEIENLNQEVLINKLDELCKINKLDYTGKELIKFIKSTTEMREFFKFEFTKNISLALELLVEVGEEFNLNRNDLANLDYYSIKSAAFSKISKSEVKNLWKNLIKSRKEESKQNKNIPLPSIIFSEKDFEIIQSFISKPNFITNQKISEELIYLDKYESTNLPNITNKIVLIEKADPGYDWIFTKNIKGLITKYGGVASHMAIRCAEFKIPAAIGCGEMFNKLTNLKSITIDCENKKIQ